MKVLLVLLTVLAMLVNVYAVCQECSSEYDPVCAINFYARHRETFDNRCSLIASKCKNSNITECKSTTSKLLSYKLTFDF